MIGKPALKMEGIPPRGANIMLGESQEALAIATPEPALASSADPLPWLMGGLYDQFHLNTPAATLLFLTYLSAGSGAPLATAVTGQSSLGKSYMVETTAQTVGDTRCVMTTSQVTVAGLFAARTPDVIIEDELLPDKDYEAIRRQLISAGRASRHLATADGGSREEHIGGAIAFVSCVLADTRTEFQNANRLLICPLNQSDEQLQFHAIQVAKRYAPDAEPQQRKWRAFCGQATNLVRGLARDVPVVYGGAQRLVPPRCDLHAARRVEQVLRVATQVTRLRQAIRSFDRERCALLGDDTDIDFALRLLVCAGAIEDGPTLQDEDRAFLGVLAQFLPATREGAVTIGEVLAELNKPEFQAAAASVVNGCKRRGDSALRAPQWTRGIVMRRAQALFNVGLISLTAGLRPRMWLTPQGRAFAMYGNRNLFQQMLFVFGGGAGTRATN